MNPKSEYVREGSAEMAKLTDPKDKAIVASTLLATVMFGETMPQVRLDRPSYSLGIALGAALASLALDRPAMADCFASLASGMAKKKMQMEGLGTDYPDLRPPPGLRFNSEPTAERESGNFEVPAPGDR